MNKKNIKISIIVFFMISGSLLCGCSSSSNNSTSTSSPEISLTTTPTDFSSKSIKSTSREEKEILQTISNLAIQRAFENAAEIGK